MQGNYCEPWVPWIQCGHDLTLERHLHRTDYWTFSTWPRDAFALHANAVDSQEPLLFEAEILWGAAARAFLGVDAWCTLDRILSNEIFCVLPEVPTEKKKKKKNRYIGSSRGKIEKGHVALDSGWQRGRQAGRFRNNSLSSGKTAIKQYVRCIAGHEWRG